MGYIAQTKCLECGEVFVENYGGGFTSHQVRCDKCGKSIDIYFSDLGKLHKQYLKGLSTPFCMATADHDKYIQEHSKLSPISEEEYEAGVDKFSGTCRCGGSYKLDTPPRCPKCKSSNLEEEKPDIFYD